MKSNIIFNIGNRPSHRVGNKSLHRSKIEDQLKYGQKINRNGQSRKNYLKKKIAAKALEERNKHIKQLFTTDKGKSFIDAIKKKVNHFIKKGEKDKALIGQKIIDKLVKNMKGVKTEVRSVLKMCKLLRGKYLYLIA